MPLDINYYDIHVHKLMLYDRIRCESFRRALTDVVKRGAAVLDVGAGTGLLSIFAAQAGARVVYAVERTKTADLARRIISANGLTDQIRVIETDMENAELPEKVDVIVSEWLGGYGIDENLLPVIVQARDRWLKPGGRMIPSRITSWIAPVYDESLDRDVQFWHAQPYGVDLSVIGEETSRQLRCCCNNIKAEHLLADPGQMWEIDPATISLERSLRVFEARLAFKCRKSGRCNALAAWFEADLSQGNALSNRPSDEYTHWGRWVFPLGSGFDAEEGSEIEGSFTVEPQGAGQSKAVWRISFGDYSLSSEDLTRLTR